MPVDTDGVLSVIPSELIMIAGELLLKFLMKTNIPTNKKIKITGIMNLLIIPKKFVLFQFRTYRSRKIAITKTKLEIIPISFFLLNGIRNSLSLFMFDIFCEAPNGLRYLRWGGDGEAVQPEKC